MSEHTSFVTKKSLKETIRRLPIGGSMIIKSKDFKYASVRTVKYQLRREGIEIAVTEKGMIDQCKVTRLN